MTIPEDSPDYGAYRESEAPSAADIERMWASLERRTEAGELGPWLPDERSARPRVLLGSVLAGIAAAALWAIVAIAPGLSERSTKASSGSHPPTAASFDAPADRRSHATDLPAAPPRARKASTVSSALGPDDAAAPLPPTTTPITGEPPLASTPSSPPGPASESRRAEVRALRIPAKASQPEVALPSLDEEVRLLHAARQRLSVHDARGALEHIEEHAQRFAHGVFTPERQMLEVQALCSAGRPDVARQRADLFIAQNPSSPWVTKLRRGCP